MRAPIRRLAILVVTAGLVASCERTPTPPSVEQAPAPVHDVPPPIPGGSTIADVAARVTPSVVTVASEQSGRAGPLDPLLGGPGQRLPQRGLASGVVISADGLIITNHHVVEGADHLRVTLAGGRVVDAKLVGSDPKSDIAVLRVNAEGLKPIEIADSRQLRIGDVVLAVGNPFGIGQTVTMGIISAVGRAEVGLADYEDFIQTDAAINPGNSGGALVDMAGRLVGINTAIVSRSGGYEGIGFAIPSAMAMAIKDSILEHGKVVRGWMGVGIQDIDEELAAALDLPPGDGVLVTEVLDDGPAARAGLRRGDLITAMDGVPVTSAAQLRNQIALAGKDQKVALTVVRNGTPRTVEVLLRELPEEKTAATPIEEGALAGVVVHPLTPDVRKELGLPESVAGVVVIGRGASGALRPGDVVLEVNRTPTPTVEAFRAAAVKAGPRALLLVQRDGATLYVLITLR